MNTLQYMYKQQQGALLYTVTMLYRLYHKINIADITAV